MAGDVMTTATAGAEGAARNGETADSAQPGGHTRTEADQETATRPQAGAPGNLQVPSSPAETTRPPQDSQMAPPRGDTAGRQRNGHAPRPARQTRQELAPAAQPASPGAGVRRRLARLGAQRGSNVNPVLEPLVKTIRAHHPKADVRDGGACLRRSPRTGTGISGASRATPTSPTRSRWPPSSPNSA